MGTAMSSEERRMWLAIACYTTWESSPISGCWRRCRPLTSWPTARIWSLVFLLGLLTIRQDWRGCGRRYARGADAPLFGGRHPVGGELVYLYLGVNAGYVIETSLGCFINPLVSVLMGVFFLHERLRGGQWAAIALAAAGVVFLTVSYGQLPWIALILAFTFGFYGLLKKHGSLTST